MAITYSLSGQDSDTTTVLNSALNTLKMTTKHKQSSQTRQ